MGSEPRCVRHEPPAERDIAEPPTRSELERGSACGWNDSPRAPCPGMVGGDHVFRMEISARLRARAAGPGRRWPVSSHGSVTCGLEGGQGRGRTADLPIFSRTLVPTELPGRAHGDRRRAGGAHHTGARRGPRNRYRAAPRMRCGAVSGLALCWCDAPRGASGPHRLAA